MKHHLSLSVLLLAACGDDGSSPSHADAGLDAGPASVRAVVVAGDFNVGSPGVLSVVDVESRTAMPNVGPAMAVDHDPVLRKHGDELFVVNRGLNNVTILDASSFSFVEQLSTGAGSNPQDVAVLGDRLFVATFMGKGLVAVRRGSAELTEIDLSADDPDGVPNCTSVYRVDDRLFVACELLDESFAPRGPGKVYVVGATSLEVESTLTLSTANPINLLEQLPAGAPHAGDLVIGTITFSTGAGCIERITTGEKPNAAGCLVDNKALGGYAARVGYRADAAGGALWLVVSQPDFSTVVRTYDPDADEVSEPVSMAGQAPLDLAICPDGHVVVSDAPFGGAGGVRIYDGVTEKTTSPLSVGLNPTSVAGLACY
jgi:DNA-binding beta-propeller fold protein YncE